MGEQRKARRFELQLPVRLSRVGSRKVLFQGHTRNVSSCGVLFYVPEGTDLVIGQSLEYSLDIPTADPSERIKIRCMGKLVRRNEEDRTLAATLERYEFQRD